MLETWVRSLGQEDPLEKQMATQSSVLAWRIAWTEEPGGLQSWGHKESDTTERLNSNTCSSHLLCVFTHKTRTQRLCCSFHRITEDRVLGEELMTFKMFPKMYCFQ